MTTVSGTNIDEIPGIIDIVVKAGADIFVFARYCPTSEEKDVNIEPMRYRKLFEDCDKKFSQYKKTVAKRILTKKIICGYCTSMKPENFIYPKILKKV